MAFLASLCFDFHKECMSGSGTRSTPVRLRQNNSVLPAQVSFTAFLQSGSLEPKRFKRRFAFFAAAGKEGRAVARNTSFPFVAEGKVTRPEGRNAPSPRVGARNASHALNLDFHLCTCYIASRTDTRLHLRAIGAQGPTPMHRFSFYPSPEKSACKKAVHRVMHGLFYRCFRSRW